MTLIYLDIIGDFVSIVNVFIKTLIVIKVFPGVAFARRLLFL